jgi:hypothetical protein
LGERRLTKELSGNNIRQAREEHSLPADVVAICRLIVAQALLRLHNLNDFCVCGQPVEQPTEYLSVCSSASLACQAAIFPPHADLYITRACSDETLAEVKARLALEKSKSDAEQLRLAARQRAPRDDTLSDVGYHLICKTLSHPLATILLSPPPPPLVALDGSPLLDAAEEPNWLGTLQVVASSYKSAAQIHASGDEMALAFQKFKVRKAT